MGYTGSMTAHPGTASSPLSRWTGAVCVGALSLALAGCGTTTGGAASTAPSDTAPLASASPTLSPSPTSAPGATGSPSALPTAPADVAAGLPAVPPAPSDDPAVGALWEALLGPDGEYAASAMYAAVLAEYGQVEPYARIQAAEERHATALVNRLSAYGITAPANPYLGVVAAPADLVTAAQAWADGEVANIAMYDRLLPLVAGDAQSTKVLTNLRRASQEMHLPAFQAAAANGGVAP